MLASRTAAAPAAEPAAGVPPESLLKLGTSSTYYLSVADGDDGTAIYEVGELPGVELVRLQIHGFQFRIAAIVRQIEMQAALDAVQKTKIHLRQIVV